VVDHVTFQMRNTRVNHVTKSSMMYKQNLKEYNRSH
jgi:hypothetical protein